MPTGQGPRREGRHVGRDPAALAERSRNCPAEPFPRRLHCSWARTVTRSARSNWTCLPGASPCVVPAFWMVTDPRLTPSWRSIPICRRCASVKRLLAVLAAIPAAFALSVDTFEQFVSLLGASTKRSTTVRLRRCRSIGQRAAACKSVTQSAKSRRS